jgi:short-subunit dehydrogenase
MALPPPDRSSTCLVTGASSGIGTDIARELAARGHGVTLVARREDRLREVAEELSSRHGIRAETVSCDLSDAKARDAMIAEVESRGLTVDALVNNAGFGTGGYFQKLELDREIQLVRVNVEAVVHLCGVYAPKMIERGQGAILNVASTVAFQPLPRQATYSASKAFVLAFTEALREDLHGTGVTATTLCPGLTQTEFFEVGGMTEAATNAPSFAMMSAAECAAIGVRGMERGRRTVVAGSFNTAGAIGGRLMPRTILLPLLRRFYPVK